MRATIDTNVYVSAFNYGGTPEQILDLNTDEVFDICLSRTILDEVKRILQERFMWPEEKIETVFEPILSRAIIVEPKMVVTVSRDSDDNHILSCALESKSDVIVTGDNDLLELGAFENISILTPRQLLEKLTPSESAN